MDITVLPEGHFIRGEKIEDLRGYLGDVPNHQYIKVTIHASIDCEASDVEYVLQAVTDNNYKDVRLATIQSTAT